MVVDDDDLVSNRLAAFVDANQGAYGWHFHDGYLWEDGSRLVYRYSQFSRLCGTSHVIRADLYGLPTDVREASETYVKRMLGSHIFIRDDLERAGTPLAPLPFPGAIYRIGHPTAHSRSSGLVATVFGRKGVLTNARTFITNVLRIRPLTKNIRDEFFHGSPRIAVRSRIVDV